MSRHLLSRNRSAPNDDDDNNNNNNDAAQEELPVLHPPLAQAVCNVSHRAFLITGGTQGLGLAVAKHLWNGGAAGLVLVSRMTAEQAQQVIQREFPNNAVGDDDDNNNNTNNGTPRPVSSSNSCVVTFVQADLSRADEALTVVSRAVEQLHAQNPNLMLTGLVNAAATSARGNLFTTTPDFFDLHMALNVRAPMLLTQQLALHWIQQHKKVQHHSGSIVNVSSVAAHGGAPFVMAYSVSKAALSALTKNNAAELAPHGIRVNAIHMGWCYTDNENTLQTTQSDPNWIHRADASVPLGRILRPHDVAVTIGFLLSDASSMTTGTLVELHPEYAHGMLSLQDTDAR